MSSDEDITDVDSGEDVVFPTIKDDEDAGASDAEESDNNEELEEGDRIDDDTLVKDEPDELDELDELDVLDDEEEQKELQKIIMSNVKDRNHKIIKIVPNDKRISSNYIQRPEMTEAIGTRVSQIEQGSPVFTDVSGYTDPILMAKKEFVDRRNPLILERAMYDTPTESIVEHWLVREMTFPVTNREIMMISREQLSKSSKAHVKTTTKVKKIEKSEKDKKNKKKTGRGEDSESGTDSDVNSELYDDLDLDYDLRYV
jgi:hypothetical protein